MSAESQVRALVMMGVPKAKAEQQVGLYTKPASHESTPVYIPLPLTLSLPWSALIPDNDKWAAVNDRSGKAKLILTETYRETKAKIEGIARAVVGERQPVAEPLAFIAHVWVPDNRPRDVVNFAKCTLDALTKIVYVDDRWLYRVTWIRAGVDVDGPRAVITIAPFGKAE